MMVKKELLINCPICNRYPVSKTGQCPVCRCNVEEKLQEKLRKEEEEIRKRERRLREEKRIADEIAYEKRFDYHCPACNTICKVILRGSKQIFENATCDEKYGKAYCLNCGHDISKTAPQRCSRHDIISMNGEKCCKCKAAEQEEEVRKERLRKEEERLRKEEEDRKEWQRWRESELYL